MAGLPCKSWNGARITAAVEGTAKVEKEQKINPGFFLPPALISYTHRKQKI